jgi:hypothetical protein
MMSNFFFFGLKFCTSVKNKYEKEIFDLFLEKIIRFAKIWKSYSNIFLLVLVS